jgi:hypothetical protein
MYDVIIIGGGPAGLPAGIYAARASMKTLLVRSAFNPSLITTTDIIENYPGFPDGIGGFELVELFTRQALRFGLEITDDDRTAVSRHDVEGMRVAVPGSSAPRPVRHRRPRYRVCSPRLQGEAESRRACPTAPPAPAPSTGAAGWWWWAAATLRCRRPCT